MRGRTRVRPRGVISSSKGRAWDGQIRRDSVRKAVTEFVTRFREGAGIWYPMDNGDVRRKGVEVGNIPKAWHHGAW